MAKKRVKVILVGDAQDEYANLEKIVEEERKKVSPHHYIRH